MPPIGTARPGSALAFFAACLVSGVSAHAAPGDGALTLKLSLEKYALRNGLEVILHEDRRTPVVALNLWYHVGSKDEAPGKNGFAHLFEHLMFQGSRNVGEDRFFKYLEDAGASDRNGTTSYDRTNYFETVPSNQLALGLWLESDRMGFLLDHANVETFESQREVVKNERRQNYENAPYGLVPQFIRAALFPENHPYHRLTIGTPADLDAANIEDVRGFFRRYYVPNNASLVLAGDIDRARARALIEKYFGSLPRGADPKPVSSPVPVALSKETRLEIEADVELARVIVSWPTPPRLKPGDRELDFLGLVLSSGKSSRLYKRLVYELQIAQDVSAVQQSSQLASVFEILVTLRKGKDAKQALAIVDEELKKLRATPPSQAEVERARAHLLSSLIFGMERVTARANAFNEYNQMTGDPGYFERDIAAHQAVQPKDVSAAAAQWLPASARIVTLVTPTAGAPRAGRLAEPKPAATGGAKAGAR
jgi:zinc protease